MLSQSSKAKHERDVFLAFASAASLAVDPLSVQSREPPEPDIWCLLGGNPVFFELGRLLDQGLQRLRIKAMRSAPSQVAINPSEVGLPERDVLAAKLKSNYSTAGVPLELLLYFDADNWLVAGSIPLEDFGWHAKHAMQPLLSPMPSHVRRVWVFERYRNTVLWCYPL